MIFPQMELAKRLRESDVQDESGFPNLSHLVLPSRTALMVLRHLYQCTAERRITAVHYLKIRMRICQLMSSVLYLSDKNGNKVRNRVIKKITLRIYF